MINRYITANVKVTPSYEFTEEEFHAGASGEWAEAIMAFAVEGFGQDVLCGGGPDHFYISLYAPDRVLWQSEDAAAAVRIIDGLLQFMGRKGIITFEEKWISVREEMA